MFRSLHIEATIQYTITPETPVSIRRGGANPVDPGSPDAQVVKYWKAGQWVPVIPGSSIKGVFRSRGEQILKGNGLSVDDVFNHKNDSHKATETRRDSGQQPYDRGRDLYDQQCAASKLFGSLAVGSRIFFEDAVPRDPSAVRLGLREGVGIDRLTGGPAPRALYTYEVVESGEFTGRIVLQNFELWQLKLVVALLQDLHEGRLRLGASTSRGLGRVRVVQDHFQLNCLDYRDGPKPGRRPLRDVFGRSSTDDLEWTADLLRSRAVLEGMEAVEEFSQSLLDPSPETVTRKSAGSERR
ncbi:CRISPR-associated RAMP protein [Kyrpidia spormannii]|uniref:CRISPR-associated RAMP protein n=1 Tax=Kyrpidia spormannii TaxID=2055160 RepID=A0A2K8N8Z2_9BACL|nr:CRISPR-associated RAMP protein Csx7 [Kyrpidia spormannii]ATY85808.1 CRISPR-associated RAMP protein [Kyrpidia spormannii]